MVRSTHRALTLCFAGRVRAVQRVTAATRLAAAKPLLPATVQRVRRVAPMRPVLLDELTVMTAPDVPEPETYALFAAGLALIAVRRLRAS
ncbi:MAG: PEP-CTERM sorting domain-containing protein [Acidobacteria bacterium]|nr:PEP-CTERM sorting domain-containing protein [Acidobacteriota bacterium]